MAPQDAATLMRLQYTVYLTGVFLSIPWKRLLSLVNKQIIKQCLRSVTMVSTLRPPALTTNFRDTVTNITLQGGKWGPKTHQVIAESQVLEFFLQINDSNTKNSSLFYEKPIGKTEPFSVLNLQLQSQRWTFTFPEFDQFLTQAFNQSFLLIWFQDQQEGYHAVHHTFNIYTCMDDTTVIL